MINLNDGTLTLIEGLEEIKQREYYENLSIRKIVFPSSLKIIGEEAFAGCHNLEEIVLPLGVKEIKPGAFFENINLKKVVLNDGIEIIGDGAFLSCSKLESINIPESVKTINEMCFYGTNLSYIDIPLSVNKIGDQAFWDCENLKEVNILNPDIDLGLDIFGCCYKLKSGYIAKGYPLNMELYDEVLYSILALTSYDKHSDLIKDTVKEYAKENTSILMEKILATNNSKALNTLIKLDILKDDIDKYLEKAFELKANELIVLLLQANNDKEDLSLWI